jgi:hypothetical protein
MQGCHMFSMRTHMQVATRILLLGLQQGLCRIGGLCLWGCFSGRAHGPSRQMQQAVQGTALVKMQQQQGSSEQRAAHLLLLGIAATV